MVAGSDLHPTARGAVGTPAQHGVEEAIRLVSERIGPDTAGLVALDKMGNPGAAFNTEAMGRAYFGAGMADAAVAVARDEPFPIY
jgi:isoaspartyl peptidase/L-asparaginase-like protein (Ntn-hydrolase superfamily)